MRIRRRSAVIVVLAAALGVGVYAITANATIPKGTGTQCSPPRPRPSTDNQSCINGQFLPNTGLSTTNRTAGSLEVRTSGTFAHPNSTTQGGFASKVVVFFDSDGTVTPGTLPTCSKAQIAADTPKQALTDCGPLNANPSTHNAWLSPASSTVFNGFAHTNGGLNGCILMFNGPKTSTGNPTVTLYTKVYPTGGSPCPNPKTDNLAGVNVPLTGTITNATAPYGKKLTVDNIPTSGDGLSDFDTKVKRGSYLSSKCSGHNGLDAAGHKFWKLKGVFTYSGGGVQPTDTAVATQECFN